MICQVNQGSDAGQDGGAWMRVKRTSSEIHTEAVRSTVSMLY